MKDFLTFIFEIKLSILTNRIKSDGQNKKVLKFPRKDMPISIIEKRSNTVLNLFLLQI